VVFVHYDTQVSDPRQIGLVKVYAARH